MTLSGRVAVLSPHLDDAVFSLGAAIAAATASRSATVVIITALAGDPHSSAPAGCWDRRCGFATAGAAASARRAEELRASAILEATPIMLPFSDKQYERGGDDDTVWQLLAEATEGCEAVLAPGSPLTNSDHRWLAELVAERGVGNARLGWYLEQPYAHYPDGSTGVDGPGWQVLPAEQAQLSQKLKAGLAYRSQLPLLGGPRMIATIIRGEHERGGELVFWGSAPPAEALRAS